jgi:NSS family neurotransmitter:Na+ symporter
VLRKDVINVEMEGMSPQLLALWQMTIKYIAPSAIAVVFIMGVYDKFFV